MRRGTNARGRTRVFSNSFALRSFMISRHPSVTFTGSGTIAYLMLRNERNGGCRSPMALNDTGCGIDQTGYVSASRANVIAS